MTVLVSKMSRVSERFSRFFDIHHGETYRVGVIACLLFFLIAGNNLIKIVRDSIFLNHHTASELPYLYILVAILAGATIATYTKYTRNTLLGWKRGGGGLTMIINVTSSQQSLTGGIL